MILFGLLTTFCSCETSSTVPDDSENSFQKDVLEEDTTEKMEKTIIVPEEDIFRPKAWDAFGMDKEAADYRACATYGPFYK